MWGIGQDLVHPYLDITVQDAKGVALCKRAEDTAHVAGSLHHAVQE